MSKVFPNIDNGIIVEAQSGDIEKLEYIIKSYASAVEIIAKGYYNSPVETEDLKQEGMIGLLAAIKSYDAAKGAGFKTYSSRCIDNAMQNAIKRNTRKKDIPGNSLVEYLDEEIPLASSFRSAEDDFISRESVSQLNEELNSVLSKFENEVLRLHIIGCSYNEIAERLGKSPKAIDNALQRVRNKLSGYFTDF